MVTRNTAAVAEEPPHAAAAPPPPPPPLPRANTTTTTTGTTYTTSTNAAAADADLSNQSDSHASNGSAALDHPRLRKKDQSHRFTQSLSPNAFRSSDTTLRPRKVPNLQANGAHSGNSARKRRKVNHACVYCRRSHMTCDQNRPCSRCVKRDIGHLCHDEPREQKKISTNRDSEVASNTSDLALSAQETSSPNTTKAKDGPFQPDDEFPTNVDKSIQTGVEQNVQAPGAIDSRAEPMDTSNQPYYNNGWENTLQQYQLPDLNSFHPSYFSTTSEVTNEYNLINDFLSTSLIDDGIAMNDLSHPNMFDDPSFANLMGLPVPNNLYAGQVQQITPSAAETPAMENGNVTTPKQPLKKGISAIAKAQENYYMTAADPAGEAKSEERMNTLLRAKYEAGLLKPFNYIEGYKRLAQYMDSHLKLSCRKRIQHQLEKFRPEFRKRVAELKDIELVGVEMWFETKLMEYDRVFASMAIPACCWRRTGEIFRGNREMAELIGVPVELLRDGKLAIHEIMSESSLVAYWEKFGSIAFDMTRKAMLTSCYLQTPERALTTMDGDGRAGKVAMLKCCFSFTVQRDQYNIPTLMIGNFLPVLTAAES